MVVRMEVGIAAMGEAMVAMVTAIGPTVGWVTVQEVHMGMWILHFSSKLK